MNSTETTATVIPASELGFNPHAIAGAWEATEELPACVAAALVNQFTDSRVTAAEGEESDRDVLFQDAAVVVEEKAVGVCPRHIAEEYAPAYVELDREDSHVLALNPGQIFTEHHI